jgi:hypothetical protein
LAHGSDHSLEARADTELALGVLNMEVHSFV